MAAVNLMNSPDIFIGHHHPRVDHSCGCDEQQMIFIQHQLFALMKALCVNQCMCNTCATVLASRVISSNACKQQQQNDSNYHRFNQNVTVGSQQHQREYNGQSTLAFDAVSIDNSLYNGNSNASGFAKNSGASKRKARAPERNQQPLLSNFVNKSTSFQVQPLTQVQKDFEDCKEIAISPAGHSIDNSISSFLDQYAIPSTSNSVSLLTASNSSGSCPTPSGISASGIPVYPQLKLWQFLLDLLESTTDTEVISQLIRWTNQDEGEFYLVSPEGVAQLWGQCKNRPFMNYEKMSRILRYYYKKRIMQKVKGKSYTYRFVKSPMEIEYSMLNESEMAESDGAVAPGVTDNNNSAYESSILQCSSAPNNNKRVCLNNNNDSSVLIKLECDWPPPSHDVNNVSAAGLPINFNSVAISHAVDDAATLQTL